MTQLVALPLPSTAAAAASVRATWEAGDAVLPLAPSAPDRGALLAALHPHRLASPEDLAGHALDDPWPIADDVALVVATSGSTGERKGVVLRAAALHASTRASLARLGCRPGERWRVPLPLHHVAGLQGLRRSWELGTDPDVVPPGDLDAIAAPGADHVVLVPTQLQRLLEARATPVPGVTLLGGAAAPEALLRRARSAGWHVVTSYGMTETCGGCVYDGAPLDDVEVALAADGRVRLRGPVLCAGYHGPQLRPATDAAGWFTTGDRGRLDAGGRLTVDGRADDVVVSGGENVPLPAVVGALRDHPAVADAAAVGRPDTTWGSVVVAVVVPRDRAAPPSLADLRDHVRASHPAAFAPRHLVVVPALPRDAMGKVTHAALVAAVEAAAPSPHDAP